MFLTMSSLLFFALWAIPILSLAQASQSVLDSYPIANHSLSLYPPPVPLTGKFQADIKIGSQTLRAFLDTGSSDTWFMTPNTTCVNATTLQPVVSRDQCGFGGSGYSQTTDFQPIDGNLNITYGNGELINGRSGYVELDFGGIRVPKQHISLATYAKAGSEGKNTSGVIGLAYPHVTFFYNGTDPSTDVLNNRIFYSPILTTIFNDSLAEPVFAMALSRSNTSGGLLTIGGIPQLDATQVNATRGTEVTVPIEKWNGRLKDEFTWYAMTVEGFQFPGSQVDAGRGQYFVDSGTSLFPLPDEVAQAYNAKFRPPAIFEQGTYIVECNATVPEFGAVIGGKTFYVNPIDLVVPISDGVCLSAVQSNNTLGLPLLLGNIWMKNVLAIFDVGKTEMTFVSREDYQV